MSQSQLKIEVLSQARTMTKSQVEDWIAKEENTTIRIILWNAINS